MFTVEVKIRGQLVVARSCNRIAGQTGDVCLYVSDDGKVFEHNYNDGAAVLAVKLLANVTNTLTSAHTKRIKKWERARRG